MQKMRMKLYNMQLQNFDSNKILLIPRMEISTYIHHNLLFTTQNSRKEEVRNYALYNYLLCVCEPVKPPP